MLIILLWAPIFCNAQYTWHALPAAPISWRFDDIYFVNPQMGWAINANYDYLSPNQYGRIFKTTDGGNTWQKLKDSANTFFRSVGFADSLTGWVGNLADTIDTNSLGIPITSDTIPLYQTNDGGITWNPAVLPNPHPAGICGISVVTDSIVYAYGRFYGPAGYVKTTDKGTTWVFTDMNSMAIGLVDGHFFGPDTGFITGMGTDHKAIILSTTDGGATWNYCYHSTGSDTDEVWKIFFPSRNIGYASIEYQGRTYPYSSNWYLKTTDGGLTWVENPFIAPYDEEGIGFINDSVGWIGGDFRQHTYKTTDGGNSWAIDFTFGVETPPYSFGDPGFFINRFRSVGPDLMYASGNTIYKLNLPATGIEEAQNEAQNINNYPNPATTDFTITAQNLINQIIITNVLGQTVYTHHYNNKQVQINVANLRSGVYFMKVNGSEVRKFVKE